MKTAVLTTTRILCPEDYCRGMEACLRRWETGAYAVCGERQADGKLAAPDPAFLAQLLEQADMVLIEADGARRLPCKAPAAHEPVILPQTDAVIAVMGLDALGGRIDEVCLRSEAVQAILGCGGGHRLTCADMAALLLSEQGSRKAVGDRDFFVVLNKCDDEARREDGKRILSLLHAQGQTQALLAAGMGART